MNQKPHPWEVIFRNRRWPHEEPFPAFEEVVQGFKVNGCERILDLGCGTGRHIYHLASAGFYTVGLDISPTGLKLTQARLVGDRLGANLTLADFRAPLPFEEGSFDGVFSTQVVHHALKTQVQLAVDEIFRVLVPGGMAFVTVSGKLDEGVEFEEVEKGTYIPLSGDEAGLQHHIFTPETAAETFQAFEIEEISIRADGHVIVVWGRKTVNG